MKARILIPLIIISFFLLPGFLPGQTDSLWIKRQQAYEEYLLIRDTMTIRTWINMRNYSEALEEVTSLDNQLIDSLKGAYIDQEIRWKSQVDSLLTQLKQGEQTISDHEVRIYDSVYQLKFLLFAAGVIFVLMVVFLIMTIIYIAKFRKWRKRAKDAPDDTSPADPVADALTAEIESLKTELEVSMSSFREEKKSKEALEEELRKLLEQLKKT